HERREQADRVVHGGDVVAARDGAGVEDVRGAVGPVDVTADRAQAGGAGHPAAGEGTQAAGVTVQLQVVAQVRVEGGAFKAEPHALDHQLREVGRGVVEGVHAGQVVARVGHLVAVVVHLDPAADAQLEGDLALVLPGLVPRVGGAADGEAVGRRVAGLHGG